MAEPTSTRPYLLRAMYEWCVDNGYTPYISVVVDPRTRVPMEHVRDGEIVLNIGPAATDRLLIGNDFIECAARFSGVAKEIVIPVGTVTAIFARETGQAMSFEPGKKESASEEGSDARGAPAGPPKPGGKPTLKRVK